jgi:hypothetical protein
VSRPVGVPARATRTAARPYAATLLLVGLAAVGLAATAVPGRGGTTSVAPAGPPGNSVKDSPGYIPLVDPESASVALGRRTNAPAVSKRFQGGAKSLDDLGRAVCRLLHRSDLDSLHGLCVTDEEFRDILWREFPQSRPVTGLTWEDGWRVLDIRLTSGCRGAVQDLGGHAYQFLRFERSDTTALYKNFKLHNGLLLVARDDEGQIVKMNWVRSVAERKGAFKIYSTGD